MAITAAETFGSKRGAALTAALAAAQAPESLPASASCEIANKSYEGFYASWKRLNTLVYALALAATVFLIGGIVLAALGSDTRAAGLVAFVGTVVTGAGARFVTSMRDHDERAMLASAKLVHTYCDSPAAKLDPKVLETIESS